jgi:hypothetical protein
MKGRSGIYCICYKETGRCERNILQPTSKRNVLSAEYITSDKGWLKTSSDIFIFNAAKFLLQPRIIFSVIPNFLLVKEKSQLGKGK